MLQSLINNKLSILYQRRSPKPLLNEPYMGSVWNLLVLQKFEVTECSFLSAALNNVSLDRCVLRHSVALSLAINIIESMHLISTVIS